MPRRCTDPTLVFDAERLERMALRDSMHLLRLMPLLHPTVDSARTTALRVMFPVDGIKIVAEGGDSDGDGKPDLDVPSTESLDLMWASQPAEVGGGLRGLATQIADHILFAGMAAVEAVPGPPLAGVRRLLPIDTLTVELWRLDREADLTLRQRQAWPVGKVAVPDKAAAVRGWQWNWVDLPPDRVKWRASDPQVHDPHGYPMYGSCMNEALADLALIQDLRDAVHNAAWPRIKAGVDLSNLHKVAVEVYHIKDIRRAAEWVTERYNEVKAQVEGIEPYKNVVYDSSGKGDIEDVKPGTFQGLEGVLSFLRQRLAQSLKTLPTLLGINDGSTFNYTSVEWTIYAQGLETLRSVIAEILVDLANYHLQLIGSKSRARAIVEPIKTNDAQVEANTESTNITNATNMEKLGYVTHDQAAMKITGRKAAAEAQPGVIKPLPVAPVGVPGAPGQQRAANRNKAGSVTGTRSDKPGQRKLPQNPNTEQTTKDERNAERSRPKGAYLEGDGDDCGYDEDGDEQDG